MPINSLLVKDLLALRDVDSLYTCGLCTRTAGRYCIKQAHCLQANVIYTYIVTID